MSTTVRVPRTTRPSLLAAALVLSAFGIYVAWTISDQTAVATLPWTLLLACSLVLPPWGLCQLVAVGVRRGGPTVTKLGWVFDAGGWIVGTVVSGYAFSLTYDLGSPDPWVLLLFLAYSVPAYVLAVLVRALAGARRYDQLARLLAAIALTVAVMALAVRVVLILIG